MIDDDDEDECIDCGRPRSTTGAEKIANRLVFAFLAGKTDTALDSWDDIADHEDLCAECWRQVAGYLTQGWAATLVDLHGLGIASKLIQTKLRRMQGITETDTDDDVDEFLAGFQPPQRIGSIDPYTLACPSCHSTTKHIEELDDGRCIVTLEHEETCLRAHRRLTNPNAN